MTLIPIDLPVEIRNRYNIVKNTFVGKDKGEKHAELEVEIGDIHSDIFQPQFKIKRWDNECNFSVRLLDDTKDVPKLQTNKNKIEFVKEKIEAHFYDVPKTEEMPEGYELEIILKEKPVANKVQMSIETKGLAFYYQPALTQEEKDEGSFRPENVVGSYAVYHESKQGDYSKMGGKNYMAGKAFHIYRPRIIDNAGKEVWGKLNIDVKKKLLTVEIPQEFLDNAVYPMIVDPTFGYGTVGASNTAYTDRVWEATVYPLSESGTAESITAYFSTDPDSNGDAAIYDDATPKTKVGVTDETLGMSASAAWKTFNFSTGPFLTAQNYWLIFETEQQGTYYYDTGETNQGFYESSGSYAYKEWPVTIDEGNITYHSKKKSIYCTYTPSVQVALSLSQISTISQTASASAQAALPLSQILTTSPLAAAIADADLTISETLAFTTAAFRGVDVALSISQIATLQSSASAAAQAALPLSQVLTISPLAKAIADADLTISETLALTTAYLIAVPTPLERTIFILAEDRTTRIIAEDRTHIIASENRTLIIPEESRTLIIPEEDRTLIMTAP